jgi:hypothetical protein
MKKFLKELFSSLIKGFLIKTFLPYGIALVLPIAASALVFLENIYIGIITAIGFLAIAGLLYIHFNKMKQLILTQNSIENKLLILDNIVINPDQKNNVFNLTLSLHNCSNQIIDIEIDPTNTLMLINEITHSGFIKNTTSIPPYSHTTINFIAIPDDNTSNILDITLEAHILFGTHGGEKTYSVSKSLKEKLPISLFPKNKP